MIQYMVGNLSNGPGTLYLPLNCPGTTPDNNPKKGVNYKEEIFELRLTPVYLDTEETG